MPINVVHLFNIKLVLDQYIIMIGLLMYNEIKRNGWSVHAEPFKPQMAIH